MVFIIYISLVDGELPNNAEQVCFEREFLNYAEIKFNLIPITRQWRKVLYIKLICQNLIIISDYFYSSLWELEKKAKFFKAKRAASEALKAKKVI